MLGIELKIFIGDTILFRGQMGLPEEQQKEFQKLRVQMNGETIIGKNDTELAQTQSCTNAVASTTQTDSVSCCQENGNSSCCQNPMLPEKIHSSDENEIAMKAIADKIKSNRKLISRTNSCKGASHRKVCTLPTWLETWEREDTYAALAVVCAAVSVAVAYSCYRQL